MQPGYDLHPAFMFAWNISFLWLTPFVFFLIPVFLYFSDHKIRIRRVGLRSISLGDLSYTQISSGTVVKLAKFTFHPHFPLPSAPYWGICVAHDFEYKDANCHVSISELQTKLWFFPVVFRFTAGTWATARLDDFRVRVFASTQTPRYIQKMRENVVGAVLKGEVLRLDEFKTELKLGGVSKFFVIDEAAEDPNSPAGDSDEIKVTASGSQYHVLIKEKGRYYTFGHVVAQLRRNWAQGTGSFSMVAEESRWTRVHPAETRMRYTFSFFS